MIADTVVEPKGIYPAQCGCGHIFLEKYQFSEVTDKGYIGFCWCGFCRTKYMVEPMIDAAKIKIVPIVKREGGK